MADMNVGVLCNPELKRSEQLALQNVKQLEGVNLTHTVIDASKRTDDEYTLGTLAINQSKQISVADIKAFVSLSRRRRFRSFLHIDQKLGWLLFGERKLLPYIQTDPVEEADVLSDANVIECHPISAGGAWQTLPQEVIEELGRDCDVIIRFGFGLLKGKILTATKYGVLSVHGSDIRKYRGLGPKITFIRGEKTVAVTLQQLSETIDGGRVVEIATRKLEDPYTLDDLNASIEELKIEIFANGIEKLKNPQFSPYEVTLGEYHSHNVVRKLSTVSKIIAKNNLARMQKRYYKYDRVVAEHTRE